MPIEAPALASPPSTRNNRYWWWLIGISLTLLLVRLFLVLNHDGYLGVDGGAYLLHAKRLMGLTLPAIDFTRPPLAPGWILIPFLTLWGDDIGYKLWAAIFSVFPIVPAFYLLATRFVSPKLALIATSFLAVDLWQWEMLVTGSLPLIGIGLIFIALWGLCGVANGKATLYERLAVVMPIGLIPYINQTSTGLAAITISTFLATLCLFSHSWKPLTRSLPWLGIGATFALGALPWYKDVLPGGARLSFPGPKIFLSTWATAGVVQWFFAVPTGAWIIWKTQNKTLKALACVLLVHSTLTLFSSYDETIINMFFRSQHVVSPLLILGLIWTAHRLRPKLTTWAISIGAAWLFVLFALGSLWVFQTQTYYSDMVTPDMDRARTLIPDGGKGTILTNSFMMGLWIAALEETPTAWTFSTKPPPLWQSQYSRTQCILGWADDCNPIASAQEEGIQYVLVDTRFPHINEHEPNLWGAPEDTWAPTESAPWLKLLYSKGTVRLWEIQS